MQTQGIASRVAVADDHDVVVCGAGPAGLGAAIAAGRGGARTLLVEQLYHVGGMATSTPVNTWCDTQGGPILDELEARVDALGKARRLFQPNAHIYPKGRVSLGGETVKAVALRMVREAGVDVLFGTTAAGAVVEGGAVRGVVFANKGGLSLARARVVVDCTADGDVAAQAGARFERGDPDDGRIMHVNFMFQLRGIDGEAFQRDKPSDEDLVARIQDALAAGELHAPRGVFRPCAEAFPFHLPEGKLCLNSWEIEKVDPSDPQAVSDTLVECQLIALEVVEFCRRHLPGHERCEIARFWDVLGTRESRRLVGRATVTRDDLLAGRKFPDGIAQACFFIDFHDSPPGRTIPYDIEFKRRNTPPPGDWYEIPYGCLLPEGVGGLLVAGRCISADRSALASLRVMPTCMFLGQAAGTAAALAVDAGIPPAEVDGREVRRLVIG